MDRPNGQPARRRLLDAAAELVAERGWGRVTTRAVAERAGLPHGAVSYHFAGKQVLLTEAVLDLVDRAFPLESVRAAGDLTGLVSLMRSWASDAAPATSDARSKADRPAGEDLADRVGSAVLMEAMREAGRDAAVRDRLIGLLGDYRQAVADLVRAEQRTGVVRQVDPLGLATLLAAAGDGLLLHAMLDPHVELAGAVEALDVLLAGERSQQGDGRVTTGSEER
ncbi:helix-turn-helix domain-containing protein [Plantactinospora sp. B6F1]|uniref:TetR/AcrR family transcriptional regulator n=1 Tax=Plantactinospora sp. B6F1 TaxID=3158971 RepID=UPI0032D97FAC